MPANPWATVDLTEQETADALDNARQKKFYVLEAAAKAERNRLFIEEMERPFTAVELFDYAKARMQAMGLPLIVDDANRATIKALCLYFTGDPEFETLGENYRLDKGLMLCGGVGTGKTHLMRALARNKRQCYNVVSCDEVAGRYQRNGHDAIQMFESSQPEAFGDPRIFYQRISGWCFDDLGTERTKKSYGNETNVMEEIILARYAGRYDFPWNQTHGTTNLNGIELKAAYGSRAYSRMFEMFNFIELGGGDRRS